MKLAVNKRGRRWQARVRRGCIKTTKTFDTQAEAAAWAAAQAGAIAGDTYQDRTREKATTLRQILQQYLGEVTPTKKGHRTETARLKDWMRRPWAALPLTSITPAHITEWRNEQIAAGKAPSTISNHLNTLSHVFKIARSEWGYRVENPVAGIRRPKARRARIAVPDDQLEAALLKAAAESKASWLVPFIVIAAWTALRQGEIRALKWGDVDLNNHDLHVRDSKNGDERWVPLLPVAEAALLKWAGNKSLDECREEWVFPSLTAAKDEEEPQPISLYTATCAFKRVMQAAFEVAPADKKPQKIRFHDLRHWACTRLADYHVDALDLAKTTGHRTLQVLARYYNPSRQARNERILARHAALSGAVTDDRKLQ